MSIKIVQFIVDNLYNLILKEIKEIWNSEKFKNYVDEKVGNVAGSEIREKMNILINALKEREKSLNETPNDITPGKFDVNKSEFGDDDD